MSDTAATTTQTSPGQTPKPAKRHRVRNTVLVLLALSAIGGIARAAGGSSTPAASTAPPATSAPAAPATNAPAPATSQPATSEPATSAPAAPAGPTVSQQQALESAKSYLDLGGFSKAKLIDQLSSPYGEKFSEADAKWAVAHCGADWNAQAVMSAKSYMEMGGFSRSKLIDQLTSPYGEQFTYAQAVYAADHVGL
jgi:hypothetical protein